MRFLLFDRIIEAERGRRMLATKSVELGAGYFDDHYPGQAVMPATMVIEALSQVGGMLNAYNHNFAVEMILMLIDGVRIQRQVLQGDLLTLEVQMLYDHPYGATVRGEARLLTQVVASVDRIVYVHELTDDPAVIERNRARFSYHGGRFLLAED